MCQSLSAGRPTIVGRTPTSRSLAVPMPPGQMRPAAGRGRPLDDASSRVYRLPSRLPRFVISVDARVINVDRRVDAGSPPQRLVVGAVLHCPRHLPGAAGTSPVSPLVRPARRAPEASWPPHDA
jgi:hypothetical protein